jgi:hypothetical protein
MKYVFALWATPLVLFWGWYFLSLNDVHFGYVMLSRQVHDLVFQLYGQMLGIDPQSIPAIVAEACIVDTLTLLAIWAFRRRKVLMPRVRGLWTRLFGDAGQPVQHALQDEGGGGGVDTRFAFGSGYVQLEQGPFGRDR